jgi:plastocyanin
MNSTWKRLIAAFLLGGVPSGLLFFIPAMAAPTRHHGQAETRDAHPVKQESDEVTIEMSLAQGFNPPSIEIETGTTVTWHNIEPLDYPVVRGYHSVIADDGAFESPDVAPGQRWSYTFLEPGTFNYHCGVHPQAMTGQIIVTGKPVKPAPDKVRVEIVEPDPNDDQSWGYKPAEITIETGTTVTWVNNGAQDHTVTDEDGAFDSGTMSPGDTFKFTFKKPGVFHYNCTPHPWMEGTVKVHEPGKAPPKDTGEDDDDESSQPPPPPPSSSSGGGPTTHHVNIVEGSSTDDWGYDPPQLTAGVGDTVVWTNTGEIDHTVTADDGSFDSGPIPPGGTFEFTFEDEGDFPYHCDPHPFMVASITVSKSASGGAAGPTSGSAHAPTIGTDPGSTEAAGDPVDATDEAAGASEQQLVSSLTGKEASLGAVAMVLSTAIAFLVGRWWGQVLPRRQKVAA